MNRAWQRRRTKKGLAVRQMSAISRELRRRKNDPLPITVMRRGVACTLTVTIGPRDEAEEDF